MQNKINQKITIHCPSCGRFCTEKHVGPGRHDFKNLQCKNKKVCKIMGFDLSVSVEKDKTGELIYYHKVTASGILNEVKDYHSNRINKFSDKNKSEFKIKTGE